MKKVKKKKKKTSNNKLKLKKLTEKYLERHRKLREFEQRHDKVFTRHERIRDELEEISLKIKELANKEVKSGHTIKLVDEDAITVSVTGPRPSKPSYNPNLVRKYWPTEVVESVLSVDSGKVLEQIKRDKLDEKLAKRAELPIKDLSPRTTIKVHTEK